jgi:hypothetical protein
MAAPDRTAFARRNAHVLLAAFAVALAVGLWIGNIFAVLGGLAGMGWVAWAKLSQS